MTEAATHTPGPWLVRSAFVGPLQIVPVLEGNATGNPIALVGEDSFAVCAANAELIAAAPDMLDALQSILSALGPQISPLAIAIRATCNAAIAKAEGRT